MIEYVTGDATCPKTNGNKIIAHICNDNGGWGKGFVVAISKKWKEPEVAYRQWYKDHLGGGFTLGEIQIVKVEKDLFVANMIAQHGYKSKNNPVPLNYDALDDCLAKLGAESLKLNASVHMPRIGCGLAGGTWEEISPLIARHLADNCIQTIVYDF